MCFYVFISDFIYSSFKLIVRYIASITHSLLYGLMKYSRKQMNVEFAKLCVKYDLDHWLWVPVEFSVANDAQKANEFLTQQEALYSECPRLDAIFVPGGDPGNNSSASLLPYLVKMSDIARKFMR